jgi:hypothetical protein
VRQGLAAAQHQLVQQRQAGNRQVHVEDGGHRAASASLLLLLLLLLLRLLHVGGAGVVLVLLGGQARHAQLQQLHGRVAAAERSALAELHC